MFVHSETEMVGDSIARVRKGIVRSISASDRLIPDDKHASVKPFLVDFMLSPPERISYMVRFEDGKEEELTREDFVVPRLQDPKEKSARIGEMLKWATQHG